MSHFYGYLKGCRGETTRCGSRDSGIKAKIRSWDNEVDCSLRMNGEGKDLLVISCSNPELKVRINGTYTTVGELENRNPQSRLECIKQIVINETATE